MPDNENALVPQPPQIARLTITYNGQQGDLPDEVLFDANDTELKAAATEAVRGGDIPGIDPVPDVDFKDFVVDRFPSRDDVPFNRISIRPKTPFGSAVLPGNSAYAHCRCGGCFELIIVNDIKAHEEGSNPPEDAFCQACLDACCSGESTDCLTEPADP